MSRSVPETLGKKGPDPVADTGGRANTVKKRQAYGELMQARVQTKPEYQSRHRQTNPIRHKQIQSPRNRQSSRDQYDKAKLKTQEKH